MRSLKATVSNSTALAGPGSSSIGDPNARSRVGAPRNSSRNSPSRYGADTFSAMNSPTVYPVLSNSTVKHLRSVLPNGSPIRVMSGKNDCSDSNQNTAAQPSSPSATRPMVDWV